MKAFCVTKACPPYGARIYVREENMGEARAILDRLSIWGGCNKEFPEHKLKGWEFSDTLMIYAEQKLRYEGFQEVPALDMFK